MCVAIAGLSRENVSAPRILLGLSGALTTTTGEAVHGGYHGFGVQSGI